MKFIVITHEKSFILDGESTEKWSDIVLLSNDTSAEYWMRGVSHERAEIIAEALNKHFGYTQ
jgi:hypothetical protein